MPTILLKKSDTASAVPTTANLTNLAGGVEVAVNTADKRMFTMTSASAVVELGTNPSSLTLTGGTANGVLYLNASKAVTSGSALVFDGTNFGLGVTPSAWGSGFRALEIGKLGSALMVNTSNGGLHAMANAYWDGTNYIYTGSAFALRYLQSTTSGSHQWLIAPSGTISNIVSWTQAMTLDASGNLGVGTGSPPSKFTLEGANGNVASQIQLVGTGVLSGYIGPSADGLNFGTDSGGLIFRTGVTGNGSVTTGSEGMRLTSTGLGIGTSSPVTKLNVVDLSNNYSAAFRGVGGTNLVALGTTSGGASIAGFTAGFAAATDLIINPGAGNLGLGVTPSAWQSGAKAVEIGGSGYLAFTGSTNGGYLYSNAYLAAGGNTYKATGYAAAYGLGVSGQHLWYTAASGTAGNAISFALAMTLDASGKLGIGTGSPAEKLDVVGGALGVGNGTIKVVVSYAAEGIVGTTSNHALLLYANNAERARVTTTGNFLVGTATDISGRSGVISDVSGNVRAIPRTGAEKTSDYTLAITDVGQFVQVGTSGSVTVPNNTFATGDVVSVFNNTTGNISLNCPITTAYVGGTNTDRASVTLSTRGVATVLFINPSLCVINGNVS